MPTLRVGMAPGIDGVGIRFVQPGSGAEAAGLRGFHRDESGNLVTGDVIKKIDDRDVKTLDQLLGALERHDVGDSVTVTFERNGETIVTKGTLQEPANIEA